MFSERLSRILCNAGITPRPEYYSGRGATTAADLSSARLERVYDALKVEVSEAAANSFAQLVADIPVLTCTDFLIAVSALEQASFVWSKELLSDQNGVHVTSMETLIGTLMSRGPEQRDETVQIRSAFLWKRGIRDPRNNGRSPYDSWHGSPNFGPRRIHWNPFEKP